MGKDQGEMDKRHQKDNASSRLDMDGPVDYTIPVPCSQTEASDRSSETTEAQNAHFAAGPVCGAQEVRVDGEHGDVSHCGQGASAFDVTSCRSRLAVDANGPHGFSRTHSISAQPIEELQTKPETAFSEAPALSTVSDKATDVCLSLLVVLLQPYAEQIRNHNEHFDAVLGESVVIWLEDIPHDQPVNTKQERNRLLEIMQKCLQAETDQDEIRILNPNDNKKAPLTDQGTQTEESATHFSEEVEREAMKIVRKVCTTLEIEMPAIHHERPSIRDQRDNNTTPLPHRPQQTENTRENGTSVTTPRFNQGAPTAIQPVPATLQETESVHSYKQKHCEERENGLTSSQDESRIREALEEILEQDRCKVCADNTIDVIVLPCGHYISCSRCLRSLRQCPGCRTFIQASVQAIRV